MLDPTPDPPTPDPIGPLAWTPPPAILHVGRHSLRIDDVCTASVDDPSAATRVAEKIGAEKIARIAVARLDRDLPGWRRPGAPVVLAVPPTSEPAPAPLSLTIVGWLSETFATRIASGHWEHRLLDGNRLSVDQTDEAGRAGGVVVAVTGAGGSDPSDSAEGQLDAPAVFAGDRDQWMCAKRNASTALTQIGLAAAAALDDEALGATASPSGAAMIRDLIEWWHPLLATHVDVPGRVAQGLSMARFARPIEYQLRARDVVDGLTDHLRDLGVASAPVVLP